MPILVFTFIDFWTFFTSMYSHVCGIPCSTLGCSSLPGHRHDIKISLVSRRKYEMAFFVTPDEMAMFRTHHKKLKIVEEKFISTFDELLAEYSLVNHDFLFRSIDLKSPDFMNKEIYILWHVKSGSAMEQLIEIHFEDPTPFIHGGPSDMVPHHLKIYMQPIDFMKFEFKIDRAVCSPYPFSSIPRNTTRRFHIMSRLLATDWRSRFDLTRVTIRKGTPKDLFDNGIIVVREFDPSDMFDPNKPLSEINKAEYQMYLNSLRSQIWPIFASLSTKMVGPLMALIFDYFLY